MLSSVSAARSNSRKPCDRDLLELGPPRRQESVDLARRALELGPSAVQDGADLVGGLLELGATSLDRRADRLRRPLELEQSGGRGSFQRTFAVHELGDPVLHRRLRCLRLLDQPAEPGNLLFARLLGFRSRGAGGVDGCVLLVARPNDLLHQIGRGTLRARDPDEQVLEPAGLLVGTRLEGARRLVRRIHGLRVRPSRVVQVLHHSLGRALGVGDAVEQLAEPRVLLRDGSRRARPRLTWPAPPWCSVCTAPTSWTMRACAEPAAAAASSSSWRCEAPLDSSAAVWRAAIASSAFDSRDPACSIAAVCWVPAWAIALKCCPAACSTEAVTRAPISSSSPARATSAAAIARS